MSAKVIAVADHRYRASAPLIPARLVAPTGELLDSLHRPLRDLRISVTDRCNFRCSYCMPKEVFDRDYASCRTSSLLTFEEIARLARLFVAHGVQEDPPDRRRAAAAQATSSGWSRMLAELRTRRRRAARPHADDQRLAPRAQGRGAEGGGARPRHGQPRRDRRRGLPAHERRRLPGRRRAARHRRRRARRPRPDQGQHGRQARHQRRRRSCRWRATSAAATSRCASSSTWTSARPTAGAWTRCCRRPRSSQRIADEFAARAAAAAAPGETARALALRRSGVAGEIGTISSVTQAFCSDCNRARLSTEGKLFLCLFASRGHDLRALLRGGASDDEIAAAIGLIWQQRDDRYSELRSAAPAPTRRAASAASRCTTSAGERRRHDPTARRGRPRRLQAAARRDARAPSRGVHLRRRERSEARSRPTTCTGSASSGATAASSCSAPGAAGASSARSAASARSA